MNSEPHPPASELEALVIDFADPQLPVRCRLRCPGFLLAGRNPTSHLQLPADDRHVGRTHFLIELVSTSCQLTNHSENGTFVNGMMVTMNNSCDLRHGDLV